MSALICAKKLFIAQMGLGLWWSIRHITNGKPIILLGKKASQVSLKGLSHHVLPHRSNNYLEKKDFLARVLFATETLTSHETFPDLAAIQLLPRCNYCSDCSWQVICRTGLRCCFMISFQTGRFWFEQKLEEKKKLQALNNRKCSLCYLWGIQLLVLEAAGRTVSLKAAETFWFQYIQPFLLQECSKNLISPLASLKQTKSPQSTWRKRSQDRQCTTLQLVLSTCFICALVSPRSGPEAALLFQPLAVFCGCGWGIWCPGAAALLS